MATDNGNLGGPDNLSNSFVLNLAYEEYCLRREQGEEISKCGFAENFPEVKHSLIRRIEVHEFLESGILDGVDQILEEISPGEDLFDGDFRVLEKLGQGALGHVFLCEQLGIGNRQTVVKVAFQGAYEANTLGKLSHPSIMPIFSVHVDELTQRSGICMPFYGRSTLCDVLDLAWKEEACAQDGELVLTAGARFAQPEDRCESILEPSQDLDYVDSVLRIGIELCDALRHSHERSVRHDDLKPSNVLVGLSGHAMLLDFNLSSNDGAQGHFGGTLPYMSPEQIQRIEDASFEIDNRSDIYSLGLLLYELLAGVRPFQDPPRRLEDEQVEEYLNHRRTAVVEALGALNPQTDRQLDRILRKCFAFPVEERYQDIGLLRQALHAHKVGRATSMQLEGKDGHFAAHPVAFGAASLVGLLLCALLFWIVPTWNAPQWHSFGRDFVEGRKLIDLEEFHDAAVRFEKHLPNNLAATNACLAFCFLNLGQKAEARDAGRLALEHGGENAAVLNNFARTLMHTGIDNYELREQYLRRALQLDPDCYAAIYNLGMLERERYHSLLGYVPRECIADIRRLREAFPDNGHVARLAADLFAIVAQHDSELKKEMFEHIRASQILPSHFRRRPEQIYGWLEADPVYQQILEIQPDSSAADPFDCYVDPLPYLDQMSTQE